MRSRAFCCATRRPAGSSGLTFRSKSRTARKARSPARRRSALMDERALGSAFPLLSPPPTPPTPMRLILPPRTGSSKVADEAYKCLGELVMKFKSQLELVPGDKQEQAAAGAAGGVGATAAKVEPYAGPYGTSPAR